ncbi:hypothetical protein PINS_up005490 [Pythium insidiosum]|nr:hypothetical protein PINS_up005490 [Pythium insidiosum]
MLEWINILVKRRQRVTSAADAEFLLEMLAPVIRDDPSDTSPGDVSSFTSASFAMEQLELGKLLQLLSSPENLDAQFEILGVARRAFGQGGVYRIRFTLVPLIFSSLRLARDLYTASRDGSSQWTTTPRDVLQFVHEMVTALASKVEESMSLTCVNLFLQSALVADSCVLEAIAYEFITQAFIVYEDQLTHSRDQWQALELMITSVRATANLSPSNYEVLATKTTQYAAKLLKKTDQTSMVLSCAHLFWHPSHQDGKRVLECLQRSLRIADACGSGGSSTNGGSSSIVQVPLFLDILESYIYFFEAKTPAVTAQYLQGLLALVREHLENMEHGATRAECEVRYRDIRRYIDSKGLVASS